MTLKKFDNQDRNPGIREIEKHYSIKLKKMSGKRKWLRDESGKNRWVLGGRGGWHGIPKEMIEDELQTPTEGMLVIAERRRSTIEVFAGPVHQLCNAKGKLHPSLDARNYTFNCRIHGDYMTVIEVPGFILRKILSTPYGEEEKEQDKQSQKIVNEVEKALGRMSREEREKLFSSLIGQIGH